MKPIIIVAEQVLDCEPILKRSRRKARFVFCQMVLRPSEKGRQTRRLFSWDLYYQYGATIFDMLDARRQFVSLPLPILAELAELARLRNFIAIRHLSKADLPPSLSSRPTHWATDFCLIPERRSASVLRLQRR